MLDCVQKLERCVNWIFGYSFTLFLASVDRVSLGIEPAQQRIADKAVLAFSKAYPKSLICSAALRAIEVDRYVYAIRYDAPNQASRPGSRRYFAVTRETDPVVAELDPNEWWPRGLK